MAEIIKRADQLTVGDEVRLADGSYVQVRGVHLPGTEWNPHKTIVRVSLGSTGWQSWPLSKQVTVIS
ncbi:hypothetical protein A5742_17895 [Mycolicibacterium fortuitum]|uniref:Uncharacterized protein n=1 Tax=Mycolicibacterium fortuitum TaxID=1766 RepID=A0ABD6QTM6_MYCFO|nr:hypothetical protein [Mycolicibacterium fortuitum]OMC52000.1 hypothetical protein A5742_17895 [Mycolicibacterium fortuitum]